MGPILAHKGYGLLALPLGHLAVKHGLRIHTIRIGGI